jgi:integrase
MTGRDTPRQPARRRQFGHVRRLPSKRWQASYTGNDGKRYTARTQDDRSLTFATKDDADAWLSLRRAEIVRGAWLPPEPDKAAQQTLREYTARWLDERDLAARTRHDYDDILRRYLLPAFGDTAVDEIKSAAVRAWYARLSRKTPAMRSHAYGLLRTIMNSAVDDELIDTNPCRIKRTTAKPAKKVEIAEPGQLVAIVQAMPEVYRAMVLLAAWCALRYGELTELRRGDVDVEHGVIRVRRGVVRVSGGHLAKGPKSEAGKRDVNMPPHLIPVVDEHLREHVKPGRDALLFPAPGGGHLATATFYGWYYPARKAAGRPDLRFHDLRHSGATWAAQAGATIAELMARLGHSTPGAAMRYQHASQERDRQLAARMSAQFASDTVVPISTARSSRERRKSS